MIRALSPLSAACLAWATSDGAPVVGDLNDCTDIGIVCLTATVVEPLNLIHAEIAADLHLDQLKRNLSRIGEAMHAADRNVDRLVLMDGADILADRDFSRALDDDSILGAVEMLLQRKPRAGFHHDGLT